MSRPRSLTAAWETFVILFAMTLVHRLLTFSALGSTTKLFSREGFDSWLVGTLSDVWISYLGALIVLIASSACLLFALPRLARACQFALLGSVAVSGALHAVYVDFFHMQIIPFHLRYLSDPEFIKANSSSLAGWKVALSLLVFPLTWLSIRRIRLFRSWSKAQVTVAFFLLTVAAAIAHNRNINFREQWFVPFNLQVNALERLYRHLDTARIPPVLVPSQLAEVALNVGSSPPVAADPIATQLLHLITKPAGDLASAPLLQALQRAFAADKSAGQKPIILVVLMESMRPAETGYFAPHAGPSLTPTLDKLASEGVAFTHAYSTGSVTRGAQEATFCGYLGSRSTSLMRGEASARMVCLPDLIDAGPVHPKDGVVAWLHGGDQRFDGQVEFWRSHGITEFMSLDDFPSEAPRNGWGIGDKTFFRAAAARLIALRQRTKAAYVLGMALSVSNHIPWALPSDAGEESHLPRAMGHPSYATTAYADAALGELVATLHSSGLWNHTLIIVASDHGTLVPPLFDLYQGQNHPDLQLASHINMLLSGGLMHRALETQGLANLRIDRLVSQADVAPLIADVLSISGRFMAEDPLLQERHLPVLSDLEQDLFDHESGRAFSSGDVTTVETNAHALKPDERKALLFYQSFLQYIYQPR